MKIQHIGCVYTNNDDCENSNAVQTRPTIPLIRGKFYRVVPELFVLHASKNRWDQFTKRYLNLVLKYNHGHMVFPVLVQGERVAPDHPIDLTSRIMTHGNFYAEEDMNDSPYSFSADVYLVHSDNPLDVGPQRAFQPGEGFDLQLRFEELY